MEKEKRDSAKEFNEFTERDENIWWYDGERVAFRTPTYGKILRTLQRE